MSKEGTLECGALDSFRDVTSTVQARRAFTIREINPDVVTWVIKPNCVVCVVENVV